MPDNKKNFIKRVDRVIDQNEKMTDKEIIRVNDILKRAGSDIDNILRSTSSTQWQQFYLPKLKDQINGRLADLTRELESRTVSDQKEFALYSDDVADELLRSQGFPDMPVIIDPMTVDATTTLTAELVKTVPENLRTKLSTTLSLGMFSGKSIIEVAEDISKDFDISMGKADRIVKTEFMRTQSIVQEVRYAEIAKTQTLMKGWRHSGKADARQGHLEAQMTYSGDGMILFESDFKVRPTANQSYEFMQFPRDPRASAANTVSCGCMHYVEPAERDESLPVSVFT